MWKTIILNTKDDKAMPARVWSEGDQIEKAVDLIDVTKHPIHKVTNAEHAPNLNDLNADANDEASHNLSP